ncbi:MAG TPA: alpha/beta fold hydrolase [Candidatus Baltobacteraceae bacterium]
MTLVFVHGAGCTPEVFVEQLSDFPDARAIALPGHGAPGSETTVDGFTDAVAGAIDAGGWNDVVLCGHSMGGAIAIELAIRAHPAVRAVVAIGSGSRLRVNEELLAGLAGDFDATSRRIAAWLFAEPTPQRVEYSTRMMARVGPAQTLADFAACNAFDATDRLGSIALPFLAIAGDADVMTPPKYARLLGDRIPGAQVRILRGAGHLAMLERPAEANAALRAFVTTLF